MPKDKDKNKEKESLKLDPKTQAVFKKHGYTIEEELNAGAFGRVFKGQNTKTDEPVAIKVMFYDKLGENYRKNYWPRELEALMTIKHPHVIDIYYICRADNKLFIVMEFAECGDIANWVKENGAAPEKIAAFWFRQITHAIAYIHDEKKMAHRDIKIDNVLLKNKCSVTKVTDFGFACPAVDDAGRFIMAKSVCGTKPYFSPQLVNHRKYPKYNPQAADVYAMGVMLFAMLNNKFPFHYEKTKDEHYGEQMNPNFIKKRYTMDFPEDLRDLQEKLLEADEEKRITMAKTLEHPWILRLGK